ncbi:hypothetical protein ACEPPN_008980 [Leptodophora sp. 'Broadleaf-Isolate-01']
MSKRKIADLKRVKFATVDMTRRTGQEIRVRETDQLRKAFHVIFNDKRDRFQTVAPGAEAKF